MYLYMIFQVYMICGVTRSRQLTCEFPDIVLVRRSGTRAFTVWIWTHNREHGRNKHIQISQNTPSLKPKHARHMTTHSRSSGSFWAHLLLLQGSPVDVAIIRWHSVYVRCILQICIVDRHLWQLLTWSCVQYRNSGDSYFSLLWGALCCACLEECHQP